MDSAFVTWLKSLIPPVNTERFKSRREFIRATGAANENGAQSYLTKVLRGSKPPPLDRLDAWADALDIPDADRQRFKDLAAIAHLDPSVQTRFISLLRQLKAAESRLDVLESRGDGVRKHD